MPRKPHITDYEPVVRSGRSKASSTGSGDHWSAKSQSDAEAARATPAAVTVPLPRFFTGSDTSCPAKAETGFETWPHGSFIGLFLFTFVVYFRPYELFSWLSWASSMAFVIAILTLLAFVPTQLGLGNLTARPREVNLVLLLLLTALLSIPWPLIKGRFAGF